MNRIANAQYEVQGFYFFMLNCSICKKSFDE